MVVVQRNEVSRNKVIYFLAIVLSAVVIFDGFIGFSQRSQVGQLMFVLLDLAGVLAIVLSLIQLFAHPKRSQVLLIQREEEETVVATNALEMRFFLEHSGCQVEIVSCTDRYVAKPIDFLLNLGPWRYLMFNSFLVARRTP